MPSVAAGAAPFVRQTPGCAGMERSLWCSHKTGLGCCMSEFRFGCFVILVATALLWWRPLAFAAEGTPPSAPVAVQQDDSSGYVACLSRGRQRRGWSACADHDGTGISAITTRPIQVWEQDSRFLHRRPRLTRTRLHHVGLKAPDLVAHRGLPDATLTSGRDV